MTDVANPNDFIITNFLQQGGAGKVYAAKWKTRGGKKVALKFFGYTNREPNERDIYEEIDLLDSLRGAVGIVQLEATFMDSPRGIVSGKIYRRSYPVIVMELLEGGELFDKIECSGKVSEKDLALVFRGIVVALDSLHQRRFLHRDLKLENLMLVNREPNSPVKIIDFGMMVRLPPNKSYHKSSSIQGTVGYVAPESLLHRMYLPASDIWQAGVCLYCMLSGFAPFHPKHPEQITERTYFPMIGVGWEGISDSAKDLVAKILVKDVDERISAQEILRHPWVTTETAPKKDLGSEYLQRIKHLGIRQKMKTFFVENNIEEGNKIRRDSLKLILPVIHQQHQLREQTDQDAIKQKDSDNSHDSSVVVREAQGTEGTGLPPLPPASTSSFADKLKNLKSAVIQSISSRKSAAGSSGTSTPVVPVPEASDSASSVDEKGSFSTDAVQDSGNGSSSVGDIDYATFESLILQCGLPELATPQVFGIFDIGSTGTINLKDFLLTMLAFRPEDEAAAAKKEGDEAARLYFDIFDINETGYINLEELKVAVACLLQDESTPLLVTGLDGTTTTSSIEELFSAIDVSKDGRIDFDEFKTFYETVLVYSTTRRSITLAPDQTMEDTK